MKRGTATLVPRPVIGMEIQEEEGRFEIRSAVDDSVVHLNHISALIWCSCDGQATLAEIIEEITSRFDESPQVTLDILNAISDLIKHQAIRFESEVERPAAFRSAIAAAEYDVARAALEEADIKEIPASGFADQPLLTIGMATFDDFDGVYFTAQALRLYHPDLADRIELLVLDNNPLGKHGEPLRRLAAQSSTMRYVPEVSRTGTAIRDKIFKLASADLVLCLDCHVLLAPGALEALIGYFDAHPECNDLIQGPMLDDSFNSAATHFEPVWGAGMFGRWGYDPRGRVPDASPFEIEMQGLGLFACRKAAWPGFHENFRGFGGEEGYIHGKFRERGDRALCLPPMRWLHRFARPGGVPYPIHWEDRIINYFIGFKDLGWDTEPVKTHFAELLNQQAVDDCVAQFREEFGNLP